MSYPTSAMNHGRHRAPATSLGTKKNQHDIENEPLDDLDPVMMDPLDVMVDFLLSSTDYRPELGVICGSGLSGLSRCLAQPHTITYESIPGFPRATVAGHAGELVFGSLDGVSVVCMRGRFHTYEGYDVQTTTLPVRVMALLGVKTLVVTNAAGGLNPLYNVGDLMIAHDHLNLPGLAGKHPLVGPNESRFGERFTPLSNCYDVGLQRLAREVANDTGLSHKVRSKGVYCFVSGPTYETQVEAKFLQMLGGDAVGMSTVPEVCTSDVAFDSQHSCFYRLSLGRRGSTLWDQSPRVVVDYE